MITFFLLTLGLFFLFIILLFIGIVQKRRKPIYISLIFFLLAIPAGLYTSYLFAQKAYKKIRATKIEYSFKRTGMEMYTAVLGKPETDCVTVINSQDAYIPKIDCCIWLEFTTCPKELARIITFAGLKAESTASRYEGDTTTDEITYSPKPTWFEPKNLGAGYKRAGLYNADDPNRDLILFFSKDSTHAFYCDMAE